jgi:hypothetical protein
VAQVPPGALHGRERLRVLLLGLNLWALCVLWPALAGRGGAEGAATVSLEAFSLLPLALGTGVLGQRLRWARPALLLVVFPVALTAALALRPEQANAQLYGPLGILLLALSLCAYGAAAAVSVDPGAEELRTTHAALGSDPWDAPPPDRGLRQRGFIAVCFAGAAGVALIAPTLGGQSAVEHAWGDAASAGGVLTAVVAAALGVAVLAVYMGSALRAKATPERTPRGDVALRIVWLLFLALLGAVTYFIVQP